MNSEFVSQNIPINMVAGQSYPVQVVMKNTGTETWTDALQYHMGTQLPGWDSNVFGTARLYLDSADSIAPGQQGTFKATLVAPVVGSYQLQWQCVRDTGDGGWFGPKTPALTITVADQSAPPPPDVRDVQVNWSVVNQPRSDAASFGKFRLSIGSLTPIMISDLTLTSYVVSAVPVGTYNVDLALISLDGSIVAGTVTGVLTVVSVDVPPPPPPEQDVPVPASLSFMLL